jgi:hypothetical protein
VYRWCSETAGSRPSHRELARARALHDVAAMRELKQTIILFLLSACGTQSAPRPEPSPTEWAYESLSDDERAVVDHERDATEWPAISDGFARAVRESQEAGR